VKNSLNPFAPYVFLFAPLREPLFRAKAQSKNFAKGLLFWLISDSSFLTK
jgi:hypothetical protein